MTDTTFNARVIASTLTSYSSGAGTVSSSDSVLQAIQKLNGNIAGLTTGVSSVFGRTGAVTAQNGDYTATNVGLGSVTNDAQTKAAIVPNTAPNAGQVHVGNAGGTAFANQTISGSGATISLASTGVMTISAIANASLANGAVANLSGTNTGDQTSVSGNAGTATALQTARAINGTNFDGTAAITVTAAAGTLTGATLAAGVTASSLTSVGTIATGVWSGTAIAANKVVAGAASSGSWDVASGGSGRATGTTAYALVATGTTATGAQQTLANGATTEILVGGGASALPAWTTAQGSGAPVRATSPTLTTPVLGVASATSINFGGSTLDTYTASGSWTPSPTSLTVVGSPTYTGKYTRIGNLVFCYLQVHSATSTAATAGTTYFTGLPFAPAFDSTCSAFNEGTAIGVSSPGGVYASNSRVYVPTWGAAADIVVTFIYLV